MATPKTMPSKKWMLYFTFKCRNCADLFSRRMNEKKKELLRLSVKKGAKN